MKKFLKFGLAAAMAVALVSVVTAAGLLSPTAVVNSASTTSTNLVANTTNTMNWPVSIPASTSVTNVTKIDVSGGKCVSLEFNVASTQASASNIVWHIGRSVSGGSPTNALGTGLKIEWFATYTNTLPNVAGQIATGIAGFSEPTASATDRNFGDGAATTFYIGWVDVPAATTLTNYSVYANTQ